MARIAKRPDPVASAESQRRPASGRGTPAKNVPVREADTASYIADLVDELAALARASKLDLLAYLLDIARLEADATAQAAGAGRPASDITEL